MNNQLKALYQSKWNDITNAVSQLEVKAASPLLIKVSDEYYHADIRVMVVGQETDGWHGCFNEKQKSVSELMDSYYDYFYKISLNGRKRTKRAFWNNKNFSFFEKSIKAEGKSVSFIWNNISKIGNMGRGRPHPNIKKIERESFNVIRSEIEILKPNLIIFTTGKRDEYIKFHFGAHSLFLPKLYLLDNELAKETVNLIAELKLELFPNTCAVRVEHPNRRTLDKKLILKVIEQCWQSKTI
jgi:hypothetical protein